MGVLPPHTLYAHAFVDVSVFVQVLFFFFFFGIIFNVSSLALFFGGVTMGCCCSSLRDVYFFMISSCTRIEAIFCMQFLLLQPHFCLRD